MFENFQETANIPTELKEIRLRKIRNQILQDTVDRVNPIRYSQLTAEQQTELVSFRQALLDVPAQAGWPDNVQWPQSPAWL